MSTTYLRRGGRCPCGARAAGYRAVYCDGCCEPNPGAGGWGYVVDREMEHLAASDRMVILTRRVMLDAAKEYAESGKLPDVVDQPELCQAARGGDIVVPYGTDWLDGYEEKMAAIKGYRPKLTAAE